MSKYSAKKLLSFLYIFLAISGIAVLGYALSTGLLSFTRANPTYNPLQVEVTNITDKSFTVSWTTLEPTDGFITYTDSSGTQFIARDVRDIIDQPLQSSTHWVNLSGLSAEETYQFTINSNSQAYRDSSYQVTTKPQQSNSSEAIATGLITDSQSQPLPGVIVIMDSPGFTSASALTDDQGNWQLNLNLISSPDGQPYQADQDSRITLRAQGGQTGNSQAVVTGNQLSPAPTLQIGQTYDFTSLQVNIDPTAVSGFSAVLPVGAQNANTNSNTITIWNPQQNEPIQTTTPIIMGTAPANSQIDLVLDANLPSEITDTIPADERGNWQWQPDQNLSLADHTVTASFTDQQGITRQTEITFTIISNNSPVATFESSPSATITQSPSATTAPSPTSTISPSPSPSPTPTRSTTPTPTASSTSPTPTQSSELSPTPTNTRTPTPTQTAELSPTKTPTPTPIEQLPQAGTATPVIVGLSAGGILILLAVGLLLL